MKIDKRSRMVRRGGVRLYNRHLTQKANTCNIRNNIMSKIEGTFRREDMPHKISRSITR